MRLEERIWPVHTLTYKILQDHLENFFSAIYIRGGFNTNSDYFQFNYGLSSPINPIPDCMSSEAANCMLDNIPILTVFSAYSEVKPDEEMLHNYEPFDFSDIDYVLSQFIVDIVEYIGGYIACRVLIN